MEINERMVGAVTVFDLVGGMTRSDGYGMVKDRVNALLGDGRTAFLLNLTQVPYIDSTCVGEVVSTFITVRNKGGVVKVYGASDRLKALLTVSKLDTVLDVFDTEAAALDSFIAT